MCHWLLEPVKRHQALKILPMFNKRKDEEAIAKKPPFFFYETTSK
jgi:hypothetical protein